MNRVLHLLDQQPDYQTQTAVEQLARGEVRTIGRGGDFGTALSAVFGLRRHLSSVGIVHAWGPSALGVAAVSAARRVVYSPTRFPSQRSVRWLRAVVGARDVQVVCSTDTMRRALVERGVPIERCHLIRPGVDFAKIRRRRDPELRAQLGFGPADYVLLALGESTRAANHHATMLAAAVMHVYEPRHKLLIWGRGEMIASERAYLKRMLPKQYLAIATDRLGQNVSFEQLLPAADAVLVTATAPIATLPIAVCMAAGLPIIAVVSPTVAELLEDRHTALMVTRCRARAIARRLLDLQDDPGLQWSISDMARTEAFEYFAKSRFVSQFNAVYEQFAAGGPVEVPLPAAGAGLRFHGRAG